MKDLRWIKFPTIRSFRAENCLIEPTENVLLNTIELYFEFDSKPLWVGREQDRPCDFIIRKVKEGYLLCPKDKFDLRKGRYYFKAKEISLIDINK